MVTVICLFFPAVISLFIYDSLLKKSLSKRKLLFFFCINTVVINGICFAVKSFILSTGREALYNLYTDMTPDVAVRYLIMAIPVCIVLGIGEVFLSKNVKVTVSDENENQNDQKE